MLACFTLPPPLLSFVLFALLVTPRVISKMNTNTRIVGPSYESSMR